MTGVGSRQCERHQLPLDARGECELCRLSAMPSKPPGPRGASWALIGAAFLLVAGGVYGLTRETEPEPLPRGVQRASSDAPARSAAPPPARTVEQATPQAPPNERPRSVPLPPTPTAPDATSATTAPPPPRPAAAADSKTFTEAEANAALREVRIEMYATTWCGSCRRAREYLDFNGIAYTEYDVDADPDAKARLATLNPRKSIPTFQIDELVQVGFSPENFEHRLNEAVRQRLDR